MTGQLIVMPDAELEAIGFLRSTVADHDTITAHPELTGLVLGTKLPTEIPPLFAWVRRIGGADDGLLDRARVDVQVWAPQDYQRMQVARTLHALLRQAAGATRNGVAWYRVTTFLSPRQMPDPVVDGRVVVLFTVEITLRGTAA